LRIAYGSKMPRSRDELLKQLGEQLTSLRISAAAYDAGTVSEAKRLAATVYILVHDGKRQTISLLTQLGVRDQMPFIASAPAVDGRNLLSQMPLTMVSHSGGQASHLPLLDNGPPFSRWIPFAEWWDEEILRDAKLGHTLTRKELVLVLGNKEGGRHFDEELRDPAYIAISSKDFGWKLVTPEGDKPIDPSAHLATMRQIAFEVEKSLERTAIS
jgi:hypothetical protein